MNLSLSRSFQGGRFGLPLCLFLVSLLAPLSAPAGDSPLSPEEAKKQFVLAEQELTIELVAAEPDVVDPVAIRFDEYGRLWVVELRDYPLGPPAGQPPLSRIRVLTDADGDGRYENPVTFAEKLPFITGLQPWKGGVIVTLAGRIAYLRDNNGDGQADQDDTWFTGFAELNSQLRANHPRLGLDGWVYVANGLKGGVVTCPKHPERPPVNLSGQDFRFRPEDLTCEAIAGNGQYGLSFDDWGNRFLCTNRNPAIHVVFENRVLQASPSVPVASPVHQVAAFGETSRLFPLSRAWTTSNLHANQFTAACGVHYYRGELLKPVLGPANIFTCDPTGNLVHREILREDGPTFAGKPAYEGREFLASPDEWFRPVSLELGPDDALYVVDMYRCVIEHPDFVPTELKDRPDQRLGDDRGRIWRIRPYQGKRPPALPPIRKPGGPTPTSAELITVLSQIGAWRRDTAARLLFEQRELAAAALLQKLLLDAGARGVIRAQALGLLSAWGKLSPELATTLLEDHAVGVRRTLTKLLANEASPKVGAKDLELMVRSEEDPIVQFQTLLALSRLINRPNSDSLRLVGVKTAYHPLLRKAYLMVVQEEPLAALENSLADRNTVANPAASDTLCSELAAFIAANRNDTDINGAVRAVTAKHLTSAPAPDQEAAAITTLAAFATPYARRNPGFTFTASPLGIDPAPLATLQTVTKRVAADPARDEPLRLSAISLLAYLSPPPSDLAALALQDRSLAIRQAAIASLSRLQGPAADDAWKDLLSRLEAQPPAVQRALVDAALARPERTQLLLDRVESGDLKPTQIETLQRNRLLASSKTEIKARAQKLFGDLTPADRAKALADYQPVLTMTGDAARGRTVFEKNCASCHKVGGVGVNVAPDISDTRTKTAAQLLGDILQPNRAIDNNYLSYLALLKDGQTIAGILSAETPAAVTFRQPGDKTVIVTRDEIEELKSSGVSLMPDGLEKNIPPPAMADLLAYLKNWRYLDGKTPTPGASLALPKP